MFPCVNFIVAVPAVLDIAVLLTILINGLPVATSALKLAAEKTSSLAVGSVVPIPTSAELVLYMSFPLAAQ